MDLAKVARRKSRPLRILVTRLRFLGDVIISTPVLSALRKRYPEAGIFYLVEREYSPVLQGNPHLQGILELDRGPASFVKMVGRIRKLKFVAALDLFYNPRSANLLFLSGIPVRAGGSRKWRRRLYTDIYHVPPSLKSAVEHHLYSLRLFDCPPAEALPRVYLDREESENGRELIKRTIRDRGEGRPVIALFPGGTWQAKRWPTESFSRLSVMLRDRFDARVLVITGPGEDALVNQVIPPGERDIYALPVLPLRVVASILNNVQAVIANDGGIMHLAVSLRIPTIAIFGPTEPEIWFPYEKGGPFRVLTRNEKCAPCHLHYCEDRGCLAKIQPESVIKILREVMQGREA
ncbi:MAG: glycosyltransferase family 9 protein [Candidatus Krumholzibacteriota bacterium]|nr:glycosyltransferase family 9 protein [Candidatus Krumholzibacteriota bacterium]